MEPGHARSQTIALHQAPTRKREIIFNTEAQRYTEGHGVPAFWENSWNDGQTGWRDVGQADFPTFPSVFLPGDRPSLRAFGAPRSVLILSPFRAGFRLPVSGGQHER